MKIYVFLGAPGSGKGTQAKRLASDAGFHHFSTGDMLRTAVRTGTPVGLRAKAYIDRGELVPDTVMIDIIENALSELKGDGKIILDGFPRTLPQATALDTNPATRVCSTVFFNIPESVLYQRLTGRRVCESCGEPFHATAMPPVREGICDKCGGKVSHRTDDDPGVVQRRLEVFHNQIKELTDYYIQDQRMIEIDAHRPVGEIQSHLKRLLVDG